MKRIIYTTAYHSNVLSHEIGERLRFGQGTRSHKLCDGCAEIDFEHLLCEAGSDEPISLGTIWSIYCRVHGCMFCRFVAGLFVQQNTSEKWRVKPPSGRGEGLLCAYLQPVACEDRLRVSPLEAEGEESGRARPFLRELDIVFDHRLLIERRKSPSPFHFFALRRGPHARISLSGCSVPRPPLFAAREDGDVELAQHPGWSARETPSLADLRLVREWMKICRDQHGDACCLTTSPWPHGLRLIDLDNWSIVAAREACSFVALSYAGGALELSNPEHFVSLESNYRRQIKPGFLRRQWNSVPQLVRDAAELTRTLGFRYIWVGNLCMVLDNVRDRARQISQIDFIYAHAELVVDDLWRSAADGGLLRLREPHNTNDKLRTYCQVSETVVLVNRVQKREKGPRFLGAMRRVVRFDSHQIIWACRGAQWFEAECREFVTQPANGQLSDSANGIVRHQVPPRSIHTPRGTIESYFQGMQIAFSLRYRQNKSAAPGNHIDLFNGTSERDRLHTQKRFHWGIPLNEFCHSLLWYGTVHPYNTADQDPDPRRTITYPMKRTDGSVKDVFVPSWSWFSAPGAWPPILNTDLCTERDSGLDWYKESIEGALLPLSLQSYSAPRTSDARSQPPRPPWKPPQAHDFDSIVYATGRFEDSGLIRTRTSVNAVRLLRQEETPVRAKVACFHVLNTRDQRVGAMYCWGPGCSQVVPMETVTVKPFAVFAESKSRHPPEQTNDPTSGTANRDVAAFEEEDAYYVRLLMLDHQGNGTYKRVGLTVWSMSETLWMELRPRWLATALA